MKELYRNYQKPHGNNIFKEPYRYKSVIKGKLRKFRTKVSIKTKFFFKPNNYICAVASQSPLEDTAPSSPAFMPHPLETVAG